MRLLTRLLALLALAGYLHAQTPAGTLPICSEACTITASSTAAVFEFGAGTKFNKLTAVKYPLVVNCGVAADCALLGGDPAPSVVKTIYAVEQAASYTVTWTSATGVSTTVQVPGTAPVSTTKTWTTTCTVPLTYTQTTTAAGVVTNAMAGSFTCPAVVAQ